MKKLIALLLTFALLLALCACGSDEKNQDTKPTNAPDSTTGPAEEDTTERFDIGEMIVADTEDCTIKITGLENDDLLGLALKVYIENKTADSNLVVCIDTASINGIQSDPYFSTDVAAGKKANEEISFFTDQIDAAGVSEYTDIEVTFRAYDPEGLGDDLLKETVHIYPYGEDKAVRFEREPQPEDHVIVDNDYLKVIVTGYEYDADWGYAMNLYLENKSEKNLMLTADEVSVNDYMLDPYYAEDLYAGKSAFSTVAWFGDDLTNNDITEVETIEFLLRVTDHDDWFADELACETILLNP